MRPSATKASLLAVEPPYLKISELSTFAYISFDNKPVTLAGGMRFVQALRRLNPPRQPVEVFATMIKLANGTRFKLCCAIGIGGTTAKHAKYVVFVMDEPEDGKFAPPERAAYADIDEIMPLEKPLSLQKKVAATAVVETAVLAGGTTRRAGRRGKHANSDGSEEDSDGSEDDLPDQPAAKRHRTERAVTLPPSPVTTSQARFAHKPQPKLKRAKGRAGGVNINTSSQDLSALMGLPSNSAPNRQALQPLSNQTVNARMVRSLLTL